MTRADLPDRAVQPPTDEERAEFKRGELEAARAIMAGDRYCPDPSVHVARVASQERPQPADLPPACERCNTFMSDPPDPCPATGNRQPCRASQERPQPHSLSAIHDEFIEARDAFPVDSDSWAVWETAATRIRAAQERPSIDVLAAFFHEEYWSETGDTHLPREQAESTDCEICWHSAAKLHGLLSSPVPVEPGE
jgi:hypothetical protein